MPRKHKYFTEAQAEKFCDARNGDNRRSGMVGSRYDTEKTPLGWVVNHYILGQIFTTYCASGILPDD